MTTSNVQLWLIRMGANQLGPMTQEEVLQGLQQGRWTYQDTVKKHGDVKWHVIENVRQFFPDYIKSADSNLLFKREFPRFNHKQWVLLHNQNELIKGVTYEMGQGGLGVMVDIVPKYWIKDWVVHIPSSETGSKMAFNLPCKMVGYRTQPDRLICFKKLNNLSKDVGSLWEGLITTVQKDAA